MSKIFWVLPILGSLAGALVFLLTMSMSASAPQQAAGYSMACALAVVPYVLARAIDAMIDHRWQEHLRSAAQALDELVRRGQ